MVSSKKTHDGLQLVRALAALVVVLFHFTPHLSPHLQRFTHWGFLGVDIFFVLSGFVVVMSSEQIQGWLGAGQFLAKRSLRIYLGYWPTLALWLAVLMLIYDHHPDMQHLWSSLFLTQAAMAKQWLPVAWSLAFEMLFYLMSAAVIVVLPSVQRLLGYACLFLLLLTWNMYWLVGQHDAVLAGLQPWRGLLSGYGLEFLAGAMLAGVRQHLRWHPAWLPLLLGLAGLGFSVGSFSDWFDKVELLRVGSFGFVGVAVVLLGWLLPWQAMSQRGGAPANLLRVGVEIGNASFALYLLHPMLIELGLSVAQHLGWSSGLGHSVYLVVLYLACVLFAWVWYARFERPLYELGLVLLRLKAKAGAASGLSRPLCAKG